MISKIPSENVTKNAANNVWGCFCSTKFGDTLAISISTIQESLLSNLLDIANSSIWLVGILSGITLEITEATEQKLKRNQNEEARMSDDVEKQEAESASCASNCYPTLHPKPKGYDSNHASMLREIIDYCCDVTFVDYQHADAIANIVFDWQEKIQDAGCSWDDAVGGGMATTWCAMCGKHGNHSSGSCPELVG